MWCEIIRIIHCFSVVQCIEREGDTSEEPSMNYQNSCQILQAYWAHRCVSVYIYETVMAYHGQSMSIIHGFVKVLSGQFNAYVKLIKTIATFTH